MYCTNFTQKIVPSMLSWFMCQSYCTTTLKLVPNWLINILYDFLKFCAFKLLYDLLKILYCMTSLFELWSSIYVPIIALECMHLAEKLSSFLSSLSCTLKCSWRMPKVGCPLSLIRLNGEVEESHDLTVEMRLDQWLWLKVSLVTHFMKFP
jgi:hypothetical protein